MIASGFALYCDALLDQCRNIITIAAIAGFSFGDILNQSSAQTDPSPLLALRNLYCERDGRVLFSNLNLTVDRGQIVRIEGPNGSGKTSLLRGVCGLCSAVQGELLWRGRPVTDSMQRDVFRQGALYLGHQPGIKVVLTPRQNLEWYAALSASATVDLEGALRRVGLYGYEDVPCFNLSAGQQRRVALARLFLTRADLWILDEPFTAIDKKGVEELEGWLSDQAGAGGAVLLTTHHALAVGRPVVSVSLGGRA